MIYIWRKAAWYAIFNTSVRSLYHIENQITEENP